MIFESMFNLENGNNNREMYATPIKNNIESQLQPSSVESVYLTPKSGNISMTPRRSSLKKSVKKTPKFKIYGDIQNEKLQNTRKLFDDENIGDLKPYRKLSNKENENPDLNKSAYYTPKMHTKLRYSLSRGNSLNTMLHSVPLKIPNETFKDKFKNPSPMSHSEITERKEILSANRSVEEKIHRTKNLEINKNNDSLELLLETPKIPQYPNFDIQNRITTTEEPCQSEVIQSKFREVKWKKKKKFSFPKKAQVLKRSLSWRLLRLRFIPTRHVKFPRPFVLLWAFTKTQSKKLKIVKKYFVRSQAKKEPKYFSNLKDSLTLIRKDCKCKCTNEDVSHFMEMASRIEGLDADIKEIKKLLQDLVERSSGTNQLLTLTKTNVNTPPAPPPPPPPLPPSPSLMTPLTINKRLGKCATASKIQSDNIFSITVNDIKNIKLRKTLIPTERKRPVGADPRSPVVSLEMLQSIKLRKPGLIGGKRRQTFGGFDESRERIVCNEDPDDVPSRKKSKMGLLQRKYTNRHARGNIDND